MKKFFAVLLTMAILSTLFAGCGSESSQPSTAAPTEASAQPASGDAKRLRLSTGSMPMNLRSSWLTS